MSIFWLYVTYVWLSIIVFGVPIILSVLSLTLPVKYYKHRSEDPNFWKNKWTYKLWMSIPVLPDLSDDEWSDYLAECVKVLEIIESLNAVPCPKGWYGGWGFTGTHFFKTGINAKDIPYIVDGLNWLERELHEIPPHVYVIEEQRPGDFAEVSKMVDELRKITNSYWKCPSNYTLKSKAIRWLKINFVRIRFRLEQLLILVLKSLRFLREVGRFIGFFVALLAFSEFFHRLCVWIHYYHFDYPSTGELLLAAASCVALCKAYDVVNQLIRWAPKSTDGHDDNTNNRPYQVKVKRYLYRN